MASFGLLALEGFCLSLFLAIYVPVCAYLNNSSEFPHVILWRLFAVSSVVAFVGWFFATGMLIVANKCLGRFHWIIHAAAFSVAVGLYAQGNLLNIKYPVLDGLDMPWDELFVPGLISTIGLAIVVAGVFWAVMWSSKRCVAWFRNALLAFSSFLLLVLAIRLLTFEPERSPMEFSEEGFCSFSRDRNLVVIVLDAFDASLLQKLIDGHPAVVELLGDFTWYRNTVGLYPTTKGALPHMITGVANDNSSPYVDYLDHAYADSEMFGKFKALGVRAYVYANSLFAPGVSSRPNECLVNLRHGRIGGREPQIWYQEVVNSAVFSYLPHFLKRYYRKLQFSISSDSSQHRKGARLNSDLVEKRFAAMARGEEPVDSGIGGGALKFYHLSGVHPPHFSEDKALDCLRMVFDFIERLREGHLYAQTSIIVMADHGHWWINPERPLFMVADHRGAFRINDEPFSYLDLPILYERVFSGSCPYPDTPHQMGPRKYLHYSWDMKKDIETDRYLPRIFVRYYDAQLNLISSGNEGKDFYTPNDFRELYVKNCFHDGTPTQSVLWTYGTEAEIALPVPSRRKGTDMQLEMDIQGAVGGSEPNQRVDIEVNGVRLCTGELSVRKHRDVFRMCVPASANVGDLARIKLHLDHDSLASNIWPRSKDTRRLGVRIHSCRFLDAATNAVQSLDLSRQAAPPDPKIASLTTFNNRSLFVPAADGERRFRFNAGDNSPEAYLRFRIPDFDPTEYVLKLKLKASPRVLETCTMRSAKGYGAKCRVKGDEGDLAIDMDPSDQFVWPADHCCYVGVGFQKPALKDGDEVELVDFKFELK